MDLKKRKLWYWLLVAALAIFLTACGSGPQETGSTSVPAEASIPVPATVEPEETEQPDIAETGSPLETETVNIPIVVSTVTVEPVVVTTCKPTAQDMLGPFYEPGAPVRNSVGEGYVLNGVVRSADGCAPVPGATIEFWLAGPDGAYADEFRATVIADDNGTYGFESHPPPPYSGRPSHIHIRVTAPGFQELVTQHYPQSGQTEASFDLVIQPE